MKKVIVSGANGFIGSALVRELVANNIEVAALDMEGRKDQIVDSSLVAFYPFSLGRAEELGDQIKGRDYDAFYHLAWSGSAGEGRADVSLQLQNAKWTADCMCLAKRLGCGRFVNAGSIMELEAARAVFAAGNKPSPGYIYGAGKLAAHTVCKPLAASIGIDLVWAMITNAYGAGERGPRLVNSSIRKCIQGEGPQFTAATQNYDFVYIDDVARAFRLIGESGRGFHEYLIGSSHAKPLKEFLMEMKEAVAPDLEFHFGEVPFTGISLPLEDFDCSKTEADTGFRAEVSFAEGCKRTRDWMLAAMEGNKNEPEV